MKRRTKRKTRRGRVRDRYKGGGWLSDRWAAAQGNMTRLKTVAFTRVKKLNEEQINNFKIPFFLSLMKYYLDLMWGKDARPIKDDTYDNKGKGLFPIPFPGQIFHSKKDGAGGGLDGRYVCVQSCIGSLNPTENGAAPPPGDNSVKNMVINGSISLKSIPLKKIATLETLLKEYKPDTETDYTDNKKFVEMYQKLYDLIDDESYVKDHNSNEKIIWGIPLIKLKYLKDDEEFNKEIKKYKEYGIESYEKYKKKYKESRKIEAFTMGEIDTFDAGLDQDIKDGLEKEMNFDKEDSIRRRYGILDLKDSNKIVQVQLNSINRKVNKIKSISKRGKQTKEEYEEKKDEEKKDEEKKDEEKKDEEKKDEEKKDEEKEDDEKEDEDEVPPTPLPTPEGDGDDSSDLENEGQDSEEKVEEISIPKDTSEEVELITSTIKKYLECPTLKDSDKKALKDCSIDSKGLLRKYVSNFLEQVLNVKHTDEGLDESIKNKIDKGIIYFHEGNILIKENYTVTIRKPDDKRLNVQTLDANLPTKLYYLKENEWLANEKKVKKNKEWSPDAFDELKGKDGGYKEDIPILSTILLVEPNSSSNKVAYISWKNIDIESIKKDSIEHVPWVSITRKISGNSVKNNTFINTINGKSSVWIGGRGVVSSIKWRLRKWERSDEKDKRLLKGFFGRKIKDRLYSSVIDQNTLDKNWTYKIGDIFLWIGNAHLYVKRNPEKERFEQYRRSNVFDTNTFHRIPQEGSYCIVVGYGVDILYTSEENENNKENIEKIKEYGNNYKHNFLLNQKDSTEEPKYLLEDYDDEISSRFIYGKGEKKYKWAKYNKDDYFDEKTGDTSYNEEEISDYQNREQTPNKRCYYIVESTKDVQDKAKLCKVYVDEANIWGVNSTRFTRAFRLNGFFGRDTSSQAVDTTQGYIEKEYQKYYQSYTHFLGEKKKKRGGKPDKTKGKSPDKTKGKSPDKTKGKSPDKTKEKSPDRSETDCESDNILTIDSWTYKSEPEDILDKMDFLRTLPCSLYNYFVCIFMIMNENGNKNKLKQMIKFFEECNNDKKIYYRYPKDLSYYEDYNVFYFKRKYIKPYLKDKNNFISSKFKDLESLSLSDEEDKDEFERLFKSLVKADECHSIVETPSKDVIEDTREINTTEEMFKLYPEIKKITDEGDFLQNYMNKLGDPGLDISDIKSFTKYGIDLEKWVEENKKFSMPFIATNRKNYMGFPAFANIIKDSYSEKHKFRIYSFGYYMYRKKGKQTLEWIDKHMGLEDYNEYLDIQDINDGRLREYRNKIDEKKTQKQNEGDRVVHAPLIIICEGGDYYIPPLCFNINPYTEAYIKQKFHGITVKRFEGENKDIRKYCHDFLIEWKAGNLLIIDNIDLTETYSDDINRSNNPIYNLGVYGMEDFSQYNSKRTILPVNNIRSLMCQEEGLSDSLQSIIDMKQNTYKETQSTIGFSDENLTIQTEPFAKILDSNVREFKPIDRDNHFLYYDFWHFSNILQSLEIFSESNQGALAAKKKALEMHVRKNITDLSEVHRFGKYDGINMFFIDNNGCDFFKYLFIKYKNDIKIFDEPLVYSKPLVSISGGNYNTLFYRWGRPDLNKIPLIINKNAVKRIDSVLETSGSLTKFYGRKKVPKAIDPQTPIHLMFQTIALKVENITKLAKKKGWLDEGLTHFNEFLVSLAGTRQNLDGAIEAVKLDAKEDPEPDAQVEEEDYQWGGGLHNRTIKKYKKNIHKTLKKNKRIKRTNKRIKRTNKGLKRTNKRLKITNKRIKRTNKRIKRTNKRLKRTNKRLKITNKKEFTIHNS